MLLAASIAVVVLLSNVTVALVVLARRPGMYTWVLALLLIGTTGAGVAALLGVLAANGEGGRFVDVSLVLAGLALITTTTLASRRLADRSPTDRSAEGAGR